MKYITAILIVFVLVSATINASAWRQSGDVSQPSLDYPPVIAANYTAWAQLIGISNLNVEPSYHEIGDNTLLFIDDLSIKYNTASIETLSADLFYIDESTSNQPGALRTGRALCFFATFEIGKPDFDSEDVVSSMIEYTCNIYERLSDSIAENNADLLNGETVPFFVGESGLTYSISVDDSVGMIIHVE